MNYKFFLISMIFSYVSLSCQKGDTDPVDTNREPSISKLELDVSGSIFETDITGSNISLKRKLPFGTNSAKIGKLLLTGNNISETSTGDVIETVANPVQIEVTNTLSNTTKTYNLIIEKLSYSSIVEKHGLLKTKGNRIVNASGDTVSFAGNSFFWSNSGWGGEKFYNASVVSWLKLDWETTIIRAAMGVDADGGYIQYPAANVNKIKSLVDAAIANGLYVIIDWHSHHAEDYLNEAVSFFTEMATLYGGYDNVIYEIYNEPLNISWGSVIMPYSEAVIAAIRQVDPDNMIIVGTPEWSQQVDKPAADPITSYSNIAYCLHFYSVNHKQWLRDRADDALESGIALFVTEWGSVGYTQNDPETELWMQWCRENKITHLNWAVNDKEEEWSIVKPGGSSLGGWTELTQAGYLARNIIRSWEK